MCHWVRLRKSQMQAVLAGQGHGVQVASRLRSGNSRRLPGLVQSQADFPHPPLQRGQHLAARAWALAVDQAIVGVALKWQSGNSRPYDRAHSPHLMRLTCAKEIGNAAGTRLRGSGNRLFSLAGVAGLPPLSAARLISCGVIRPSVDR
jgi:hypothetical protein